MRIVTVAVSITDSTIGAMDNDLGFLILSDLTSNGLSLTLCACHRSGLLITRSLNSPIFALWDNMLVFTHKLNL